MNCSPLTPARSKISIASLFIRGLVFLALFLTTLIDSAHPSTVSIDDFTFMTENYPPYNFEVNGTARGIAADILELMLQRIRSTKNRRDFELVPWARGYNIVQNVAKTCLFAMSKTSEREALFKWVGPVASSRIVLIARKDRKIHIKSIADLNNYTIGAVRDDIGEQLLIQNGIDPQKIESLTLPELNAKKMEARRIDLWAYGDLAAGWIFQKNRINPDDYESVFVLKESDAYFAFHKSTPDFIIKKLQQAFDEIQKEEIYQQILDRYLKLDSKLDNIDKIAVTIWLDDAYRPFSYEENGRAKGLYVNILTAAFAKMSDFKVSLKPVPWKRGKKMMENGTGFGLAPVFFHAHDWPYLYPYSLPFYTETIVTMCKADLLNKKRCKWPDDYKGLTVGNAAGFDGWGGKAFRKLVDQGQIEYFEMNGSEKLIKMALMGRFDCIMMEKSAFQYELRRLMQNREFKKNPSVTLKQGTVVGKDPVYIGYSETALKLNRYPFHHKFRKAFDSAIYQMQKNNEIAGIVSSNLK